MSRCGMSDRTLTNDVQRRHETVLCCGRRRERKVSLILPKEPAQQRGSCDRRGVACTCQRSLHAPSSVVEQRDESVREGQRARSLRKEPFVQRQCSERALATLVKPDDGKARIARARCLCARRTCSEECGCTKKGRDEGNRPAARANQRNTALGFAGSFWRSFSTRRWCARTLCRNA